MARTYTRGKQEETRWRYSVNRVQQPATWAADGGPALVTAQAQRSSAALDPRVRHGSLMNANSDGTKRIRLRAALSAHHGTQRARVTHAAPAPSTTDQAQPARRPHRARCDDLAGQPAAGEEKITQRRGVGCPNCRIVVLPCMHRDTDLPQRRAGYRLAPHQASRSLVPRPLKRRHRTRALPRCSGPPWATGICGPASSG
jgi:hypothetical protein